MKYVKELPWSIPIVLCLTLGLAPFTPPHLIEKLVMLFNGDLKRAIDWFDLCLHGSPWLLLVFKILLSIGHQRTQSKG